MGFRGLSYGELYLYFYFYLAVLTVTSSDAGISQRYSTITTAWLKPLVRSNASPGRSLILCPSVWWPFRKGKGIRKNKTRNCFRSLPREKANNKKKKGIREEEISLVGNGQRMWRVLASQDGRGSTKTLSLEERLKHNANDFICSTVCSWCTETNDSPRR